MTSITAGRAELPEDANGDESEYYREQDEQPRIEERNVLRLDDGSADEGERPVVDGLARRAALIRELRERWIRFVVSSKVSIRVIAPADDGDDSNAGVSDCVIPARVNVTDWIADAGEC